MTRRAFLSFVGLILVLSLVSLLFAAGPPPAGHALGGREQWQPQFTVGGAEADPRLHAPVTVDLVGRSAISVLAELSTQTGVSLQTAPEDLATVGERKLTLFVHAHELMSVMVQIPEALRECHWDIVKSGPQPVYYLHCNAEGADPTGASQDENERLDARARANRVERLESLKRALAMSPDELREFEKEDLFLAKSLQDPDNRAQAELIAALPPDQLQVLVDEGRVQPRYADLSPELKAGFERMFDHIAPAPDPKYAGPDPEEQAFRASERDRIDRWRRGPDPRVDIVDVLGNLNVGLPDLFLCSPIPSRFPTERDRDHLTSLLQRNASARTMEEYRRGKAEADRVVSEWIEKGRVAQVRYWDSSLPGEGNEPTDPALLREVSLRSSGRQQLSQLQREIAADTGLNLLSDYFSERPVAISGSLTRPQPLWRLLNALCTESNCVWKKAGSYLIFHHIRWADLAPGEIPEAMLAHYRKRIEENGHLTMADAAEFAVAWEGKDMRAYGIPMDLQHAGLSYSCASLLFYAALTPEQTASARRPSGLPCRDLTARQRKRLADMIAEEGKIGGSRLTLDEAISRGSFHVAESAPKPVAVGGETEVRLFVQLRNGKPPFRHTFRFQESPPRRDDPAPTAAPATGRLPPARWWT